MIEFLGVAIAVIFVALVIYGGIHEGIERNKNRQKANEYYDSQKNVP